MDPTQYQCSIVYGLLKYVIKEDLITIDNDVNKSRRTSLVHPEPAPQEAQAHWVPRLFAPDLADCMAQMKAHHQPVQAIPMQSMRATVLASERVQKVITSIAQSQKAWISPASHFSLNLSKRSRGL